MKAHLPSILLLSGTLVSAAQVDIVDLKDVLRGAQEWAAENLDTNLLEALPEMDQEHSQQFLRDIQKQFQAEYVVDLAAMRSAARVAMPLLESHEETRPYAVWLGSRLDYLKIAEEFTIAFPEKKVEPGKPSKPIPNPTAARQREVWVSEVAKRSWPSTSSNLVARLKPIFAGEKIPAELVWLAEVESSFNVQALSPAGAAGLFQLMPATAKRFGLSLWPRDQRLQAEASGRASARYLKLLCDRFKDWRLALAAYNSGEGTVSRLMKKYNARTYDEIATRLPAETQMFVPKVEAVLLRREAVRLVELPLTAGLANQNAPDMIPER